ncbi:MAG: 3-oxoacyl-ACP reductase family protein [Candidatus Moraniibacteriota bacterium]
MSEIRKRVALITGGAIGIGKAIAERLAQDGFFVVINYHTSGRDAERLLAEVFATKGDGTIIQADVASAPAVQRMLRQIRSRHGGLDVLVCNAGINQSRSVENIDYSAFQKVLDVNLFGAVNSVRWSVPLLRESADGRIVFISSTNPFKGSPNRAIYTASKAALLGLTRSLAVELAPNILVNAVVPGYIDTKMFQKFSSESRTERVKKILLGRIGNPEDVASAVSFLCSRDSSYITGQYLHVNGGVFSPE